MNKSLIKYRYLGVAIVFAVGLLSHYGIVSAATVSKSKMQHISALCKGLSSKNLKYMDSQVKALKEGKFNDYVAEIQEDEGMSQAKKIKTINCYKAKLKAHGLSDKL